MQKKQDIQRRNATNGRIYSLATPQQQEGSGKNEKLSISKRQRLFLIHEPLRYSRMR